MFNADLKSLFSVLLFFLPLSVYLLAELHRCQISSRTKTKVIHVPVTKPDDDRALHNDAIETPPKYHDVADIATPAAKPRPPPTTKSPVVYLSIKPMHCVAHGMRQHCVGALRKNLIGVNQCKLPTCACFPEEIVLIPPTPTDNPYILPPKEMLPVEKETLHDPEFVDIVNTVNANYSKIQLLDIKNSYVVGDLITVRIDLVDGHKQQRRVGGDDVRITMRSQDGRFASGGQIQDLKNGTYLGKVKVLFPGKSKIEVVLPNTRESLATVLKWRRDYKNLFYYYGEFKRGTLSELTLCSMYPSIPGYDKICNLTSMNYDYDWFCGRPLNPLLGCGDFILANDFDFVQIPFTPAQFITFNRDSTLTKMAASLQLSAAPATNDEKKKVLCNQLPRSETWDTNMPSGFFQNRQWTPLKCENNVTRTNVLSRLRDTTLIIFGDSTTRQWYTLMHNITDCQQETELWTKRKWYEISSCVERRHNFRLMWSPHVFPFPNGRKLDNGKSNLKSARQTLKELPPRGKIIVVLHYYAHFIRQHYSLFRSFVRSLKPALREALRKNPDLQVAIKGPHVFYDTSCPSHISDFAGPMFNDIIKWELREFHDSVWFLNYWEQTLAIDNRPIHPATWVVWENLRTLFGYTLK